MFVCGKWKEIIAELMLRVVALKWIAIEATLHHDLLVWEVTKKERKK